MPGAPIQSATEAAPFAVDVCVCTFRRVSLRQTLNSLAAQVGAPPFRIIIADNDDAPSADALTMLAAAELDINIKYLHAPAGNISLARNACLEAAHADLLAFIDDDEIAPPTWLATMVNAIKDCDAVFGPVKAQYGEGAPNWVVRGDFHSFGPAVRANGEIDTGYSSNVLFRRSAVGGLRFDPSLGRSGGEDTVFFARLHAGGGRLRFCPEAMVVEPTPSARTRLSWLLRRAYRSGQTHARVLRLRRQGEAAIAALAFGKAVYCLLAAALTAWSPVRVRANLIRGALHAGVLAKAFGAADLELYASTPAKPAG